MPPALDTDLGSRARDELGAGDAGSLQFLFGPPKGHERLDSALCPDARYGAVRLVVDGAECEGVDALGCGTLHVCVAAVDDVSNGGVTQAAGAADRPVGDVCVDEALERCSGGLASTYRRRP